MSKIVKQEYDENGNETYCEYSDGYWEKSEYDENGNETYFEDSTGHKKGISNAELEQGPEINIDK